MKRLITLLLIFSVILSSLIYAQEVDREELQSVDLGSVEFLNYEGPHEVINTRNQIIGIGTTLGLQKDEGFRVSAYLDKYRVIHALGPEDEPGIPADIFILEAGAGVDHIRNLRRIIAGYLSEVYGYDFDTAFLIAEFVTVYNAVFRGDMEMIRSKYSATVQKNLQPEKVGISTKYFEWPGNTMMLIPLGRAGKAPGREIVSTEEISDKAVIERFREEEDRGVEERKGMVELREQEVESEQQRIAEERRELEEEEQTLREKEERLKEDLATAEESEKEETVRELEETHERLEETEARKQELEIEEAEQEERVESIREERERIAEDEKEQLTEDTPAAFQRPEDRTIFLITSEKGGAFEGFFVQVDPITGEVKKQAEGITVIGRTYTEQGSRLYVLGKENGGIITLLQLNPESLEVVQEGSEAVHPASAMVLDGSNIYAVVSSSGSTYLARFNKDLELVDRSDAVVMPFSYIKKEGKTILVQGMGGDILVLDAETLEQKN
ncbi:MAG: hypothetical protein JW760_00285 [Spirochaetales bacterium]|nr:hypothetical protein [Spirochaetales bacterium]